jgi:hypothetical protein
MKRAVKVYVEGQELDLFDDEQIQVSSSVQNVYDISKSNTDISQSFTVPGSPNNNRIFQHFYETDVDGTIDHGLRRDGFIEIDLTTFKKGRIQLDKANVEKGKIKSYTITFYGKLVSLKDLFGEDKLQDLDHSGITHQYDWTQVHGRITGAITSDVQYPLISSNRLWEYNGTNPLYTPPNWLTNVSTNNNIHTAGGAINVLTELFPAVSLNAIINMIATKYGITFNSTFFGTEQWRAAYLWYKNRNDVQISTPAKYIDFDTLINNVTTDIDTSQYVNLSLNSINPQYQAGFPANSTHAIYIDITSVSSSTVTYYVDRYVNGVLTTTVNGTNGDLDGSTGYRIVYIHPNVAGLNDTVLFKVRADAALSIDMQVKYQFKTSYSEYTCVTQNLIQDLNLETCAPDMKIADFFSGILKEFNMVVENTGDNEYTVEPLLDWYAYGQVYDITTATDFDSFEIAKVPLYKKISFKYQPSESTMNKYYLQQWQKEYGDTEHLYPYDGGEYNIQVPFENLMFNQYDHSGAPTGLQVGFALNSALAPYVPKPCILYRYGVVTGLPHHIVFKDGVSSSSNDTQYVMFGQDYTHSTTGIQYSLNFAPETSTYHRYAIQLGIFGKYYFQYLYNLYSLKNRITTVKAVLPLSILSKLRLNDRVVIRDKRYIINDMQTNLTTGQATLRLLNDFMPVGPDNIPPDPTPEE